VIVPTRLCVIIVNYKTAQHTLDCIDTLKDQLEWGKDRVVVVDNASGAQDLEQLTSRIENNGLRELVTVITCAQNRGFSAGNNAGLEAEHAAFYLLANSDTLFRHGAVAGLLEAARENPKAGIISPRLEWPNGDVQMSCFRFPTPLSDTIRSAETGLITKLLKRHNVILPNSERESRPEWTSFAAVLIRREVFDRIGLLDENYFMYYEDVDYCRRARNHGYDIVNWPFARVVHFQGKSSGLEAKVQEKKRLPAYYYHSRARYHEKFHGELGLLAANVCWYAGRLVSLSRELCLRKARTVADREFLDIWKR
jgi:N-acetylglucosaminyl-diphospho-decaprenol L-rhamnosyltransferase